MIWTQPISDSQICTLMKSELLENRKAVSICDNFFKIKYFIIEHGGG